MSKKAKQNNNSLFPKFEILDCTIRDGGYINDWNFDKKFVRETYRMLSKSGIDYVELGYQGSEKYFDKDKYGTFRFSWIEDINYVCQGIDGAKVSLMVDYGKFDLDDLNQYKNSPVQLIRIAFHKNKLKKTLDLSQKIKAMGFSVSVNFMGFSSCNETEKRQFMCSLKGLDLDYVYISDTYGSMYPNELKKTFHSLSKMKTIKWGFHPHNNLQMAFANSLAAIEGGAGIIDSTIYGMGRGAGNLPTEIILSYFHHINPNRYNVIPVLNIIDKYYTQLHQKYKWGYNLAFMLSGIYGCHPHYAKNLIERREYDIEDIWNILKVIRAKNPVGFSKELIEETLNKGFFGKRRPSFLKDKSKSFLNKNKKKVKVTYINRHIGQDFLVLANGPSLKENQNKIELFIDKYNPIVLGANYLGGLFKPHYHAFANKRRFTSYVDTVNKGSKLLISQHIPLEMIEEYTDRDYETIYYEDVLGSPFDIRNGIISSNCRTVSILLIGIAIVMGAKRIFVAGLDGYMDSEIKKDMHFYKEEDETKNREIIADKHFGNLAYLEDIEKYLHKNNKEGIHVITPTSYTKFYKGIDNYL